MRALKVLWGLLVDDVRLVSVLIVALFIAYGVGVANYKFLAAVIIWLGLIVSLWVSINHQLKVKRRSSASKE